MAGSNGQFSSGLNASPKSYEINKILLARQFQQQSEGVFNVSKPDERGSVNITEFVDKVEFAESLYSMGLTVKLTIADPINLLENEGMTGCEYLWIEVKKKNREGEEPSYRRQWFYVIDYPLFSRPKPDVQVFEVVAVSAFGFLSKVLTTQKVYEGGSGEILTKVLADLAKNIKPRPNFVLQNVPVSFEQMQSVRNVPSVNGTYRHFGNGRSFFDIVQDLKRYTFDQTDSRFFLFESFAFDETMVVLDSYGSLVSRADELLHDTYSHAYFYTRSGVFTEPSFAEQRQRILSISSKLGFSAFRGITNGGYTAQTQELDLAYKTYREVDYNVHVDNPQKINRFYDYLVDSGYDVSANFLEDFQKSKIYKTHRNSLMFSDTLEPSEFSHESLSSHRFAKANATDLNLDQLVHTITIYADTSIRAGKFVNLRLPKSKGGDGVFEEDDLLSGLYLIVSVNHRFTSDGAFTDLRVKRESGVHNPVRDLTDVSKLQKGFPTGLKNPEAVEQMRTGGLVLDNPGIFAKRKEG